MTGTDEPDRCAGTRADGEACQAYAVEGSAYCIAHTKADEREGEADAAAEDRCGHPTTRGGLCRQYPMAGAERCYHHAEIDPTEDEQAAARSNPVQHGYFVKGFLDEDEKRVFEAVLEGHADPGEIKQHVLAALVVRANRMMAWEANGREVSGFANEVFGELRKVLESISPDELTVQHSWDAAEVARQVEEVLEEDPELLVRLLPPEVQGEVREAIGAR